jgi:hypothetical protein
MSNSDLPQGTADDAALSFDEGADAISNLFQDSGNGTSKGKVEAHNAAEDQADEPEDGEIEVDAETDEQVDDVQDAEDGPDEVGSGGKFVSNDAKVTLNDGTVITVEALKRGFMSQQSFTRSSQENATERKALADQKAQVGQIAQAIAQQRDFILQAAQALLPKAPDRSMMDSDPLGYMQAKAAYDDQMGYVNQLLYQQQAERGRLTQEQEAEQQQFRQGEYQRLLNVMPELKDRKVYEQFWSDATETASHYGYTAEEFAELATDHRLYPALRDLVKYRKAMKQAPKVKQDMQQRPKLMQGGKRMDPKAKTSRDAQARSDQLRKTGSFEAGVRALEDLI